MPRRWARLHSPYGLLPTHPASTTISIAAIIAITRSRQLHVDGFARFLTAIDTWQIVYEGESNVLAMQPGRVFETDIVLPDAPEGQLIVEITHSGARDKPYTNRYKAIPADRRFRLKLEPQNWAKVTGTLSARVTSPDSYTYSYITKDGHYIVRFDADFETWPKGGESVPLRLAKPFAGKLQTGMHFPALDDAEAVIQCRDGDPDKPEITAFHHHSQARDLITNDRRWLSRNVIRTQKNNKLRFEDWAGQEGAKLSTEHSGKSQLNLGYLVHNKLEYRGEGFEARTSGYGVNRAGKGMMLTAWDRPAATGKQLDMQETIAQLESAIAAAKALAASASSAKAEPADTDAQQQMKDDLDGLKQPGLLMSTPASAALVSSQGIQFAAQGNINAVAGKNADWSVLKRWTVAAGEKISLFAQKFGIKIFAAKGPVNVQAQNGPMSFTAASDMNVASVNGKVNLSAAKEIILECGGAFVQIKDGSITLGGPGDLFLKTITVQKKGRASRGPDLPVLPSGKVGDMPHFLEISHHYEDLQPVKNAPYTVRLKNGTTLSGTLDERGFARLDGVQPGQGTADLGEDVRQWTGEPKRPNNDSDAASDAPSGISLVRTLLS